MTMISFLKLFASRPVFFFFFKEEGSRLLPLTAEEQTAVSHSQFSKLRALSYLNTFSATWSDRNKIKYTTIGGGIANEFPNKLLRYWLKTTKLTANKRRWYVRINNRLWVKFSTNRCDFLIKERTEVVRKFRFRNVTGENGTFALSKQLISKPIQLYAWIALWQVLAKVVTFSIKNYSFFHVSLFCKNLFMNS